MTQRSDSRLTFRLPRWWPFEVYSLGPERWEKTASSRYSRPRLPHVKRLNWHGAPPYGISVRWLRFRLVYWLPRWWCLRRWLGA